MANMVLPSWGLAILAPKVDLKNNSKDSQNDPPQGRGPPVSIFFVKNFLRVAPFSPSWAAGLLCVQRELFFMPSLTISELQRFLGSAFSSTKKLNIEKWKNQ